MRRERGFVLPFAVPTWLIYVAVLAAALGALWYAYTTIDGRGYTRGKSETEAAFVKRDNKALQDALAKVEQLQAEVQAREQAHADRLEQIRTQQRKEAADAKRQHDADLAAVRAGTLRLRDPGSPGSAAQCDHRPAPAPGAAAGQRDGAPATELSAEASGFLLQLMLDADAVTRQLGDAQDVIRAQIKACNGP
jgi:hypothetical protein